MPVPGGEEGRQFVIEHVTRDRDRMHRAYRHELVTMLIGALAATATIIDAVADGQAWAWWLNGVMLVLFATSWQRATHYAALANKFDQLLTHLQEEGQP